MTEDLTLPEGATKWSTLQPISLNGEIKGFRPTDPQLKRYVMNTWMKGLTITDPGDISLGIYGVEREEGEIDYIPIFTVKHSGLGTVLSASQSRNLEEIQAEYSILKDLHRSPNRNTYVRDGIAIQRALEVTTVPFDPGRTINPDVEKYQFDHPPHGNAYIAHYGSLDTRKEFQVFVQRVDESTVLIAPCEVNFSPEHILIPLRSDRKPWSPLHEYANKNNQIIDRIAGLAGKVRFGGINKTEPLPLETLWELSDLHVHILK